MVRINYRSIRHVFRVQKHILAHFKLSNFSRRVVPLSLERHILRSVIIGGGRHTPSQCCLTLSILPALSLATSNQPLPGPCIVARRNWVWPQITWGFWGKSNLVYIEHLFTLLHFHETFYRQFTAFSRSFNFYILAVKDAGCSATYEK